MRKRNGHPLWIILMTAALSVVALYAYVACKRSLFMPCVQSGWLAAAVIAAVALSWWAFNTDGQRLCRRMRRQLCFSCLLVVLFAIHIDMRVPNGWIGLALTILFIAVIASTIVGAVIIHAATRARDSVRRGADATPDGADLVAVRRWLFVNVPLSYSLLGLAIIHGLFVHSHGTLAFYFLER